MNAKGRASSLRFSARWKQTRPTWCQLGARARRNAGRPPEVVSTASRTHSPKWLQTPCRLSSDRYSPPCIGGAARIQAAQSPGDGRSTSMRVSCSGRWHSAVR